MGLAALHARIAATTQATLKTPMMPLALPAPTANLGGLAMWTTCAIALIRTTRRRRLQQLKLLQPQKRRLKRRRLLPLRKQPPRKLLPQPQRLPPQPNTQRGIALKQPKRQPQRSQQLSSQPQSSHQQVATVMRAVLNA